MRKCFSRANIYTVLALMCTKCAKLRLIPSVKQWLYTVESANYKLPGNEKIWWREAEEEGGTGAREKCSWFFRGDKKTPKEN